MSEIRAIEVSINKEDLRDACNELGYLYSCIGEEFVIKKSNGFFRDVIFKDNMLTYDDIDAKKVSKLLAYSFKVNIQNKLQKNNIDYFEIVDKEKEIIFIVRRG